MTSLRKFHFRTRKQDKYGLARSSVNSGGGGGVFNSFKYCHFYIQSLSHVQLFVTQWTEVCQASLSITNSQSLLKLMFIESVMPSNHLILFCPLLLPPSIFPSIRVFSNESLLRIRWPNYWSLGFNISPSNEYSELISFRVVRFDLLEVQGTLKSLQHHTSKASILWHSAFFIVQLSSIYDYWKSHSYDYMDYCFDCI